MGKKSKNYSKDQFIKIVCVNCSLCKNDGGSEDADFCYYYMYQKNPKRFFKSVLPKLKKRNGWPKEGNTLLFQSIFCEGEVCTNNIETINDCVGIDLCQQMFIEQIYNKKWRADNREEAKKEKPIQLPKKIYIKEQLKIKKVSNQPTFITNGDDSWMAEIQRIIDGNYYKEPNIVKECSRTHQEDLSERVTNT